MAPIILAAGRGIFAAAPSILLVTSMVAGSAGAHKAYSKIEKILRRRSEDRPRRERLRLQAISLAARAANWHELPLGTVPSIEQVQEFMERANAPKNS